MKQKVKKALAKRIKITKTGKIKKLQASRSHLQRNKTKRTKRLLNLNKADRKLTRLI